MKRDFTIIDTSNEKIVESRKGYVELFPEYLKLVLDYKSYDVSLPGVEKDYFNNRIVDRLSIADICLYRGTESGNWCIDINSDMTIQYKGYDDAKQLFNEIIEWRYH